MKIVACLKAAAVRHLTLVVRVLILAAKAAAGPLGFYVLSGEDPSANIIFPFHRR
jgi:hypothetical protein